MGKGTRENGYSTGLVRSWEELPSECGCMCSVRTRACLPQLSPRAMRGAGAALVLAAFLLAPRWRAGQTRRGRPARKCVWKVKS